MFWLQNQIILQPECSKLKFPGLGTAFRLTLTPAIKQHINYKLVQRRPQVGSRFLWITAGLLGSGQVRLKILETYFTVCGKIYLLIVIQTCPWMLTHPCNVQVIMFYFVVHYMHNSRAWCLRGFKFININLTTGRMLFRKFNFGCHHELVISGRLTANGYVDVGSYATVLT